MCQVPLPCHPPSGPAEEAEGAAPGIGAFAERERSSEAASAEASGSASRASSGSFTCNAVQCSECKKFLSTPFFCCCFASPRCPLSEAHARTRSHRLSSGSQLAGRAREQSGPSRKGPTRCREWRSQGQFVRRTRPLSSRPGARGLRAGKCPLLTGLTCRGRKGESKERNESCGLLRLPLLFDAFLATHLSRLFLEFPRSWRTLGRGLGLLLHPLDVELYTPVHPLLWNNMHGPREGQGIPRAYLRSH